MSSNFVQRVSKTVLAIACGFAFTFASGCCSKCHKPCCKDKDKEMSTTTTTHEKSEKTEKH